MIARIQLISSLVKMKKSRYIADSIVPVVSVAALVFAINYYIDAMFSDTLSGFFLSVVTSVVLVVMAVLVVGLKKNERALLGRVFFNMKKKVWH